MQSDRVNLSPKQLLKLIEIEEEQRRRARLVAVHGDVAFQNAPTFRGSALELQSLNDHEIVIAGPYETGKTYAALWRIDSLLREYPGSQALMLRKVRNDMDASCIMTYKKIIERRGGVSTYGGEKPQWFDYKNRSRLWIAGLDNPGKALSAEYDFIYPNQAEQFLLEDWQTLTTRCTGRAGNAPYPQIIGDANPGGEDHWILKREALGILRLLRSYHRDNPRQCSFGSFAGSG